MEVYLIHAVDMVVFTDEFRAELVDIIGKDDHIDRVYQVNLQIFPLTNLPEEKIP